MSDIQNPVIFSFGVRSWFFSILVVLIKSNNFFFLHGENYFSIMKFLMERKHKIIAVLLLP